MKANWFWVVTIGVVSFVCGCARDYNITTNSGRVITSRGKPHYDRQNAVFVFKDIRGVERQIPAGSVSQISPASDKSGPGDFNPKPAR